MGCVENIYILLYNDTGSDGFDNLDLILSRDHEIIFVINT